MALSPRLRFEVFKRDNFICQYCGKKTPEVILEADHVIPSSKGGTDDLENLITSCFECNRGKGNTLLDTIMKDRDIHVETLVLAEKEMQLAEYNRLRETIREREDNEIEILTEHFCKFFSHYEYYAKEEFFRTPVRQALKIISYIDIMDYIDIAVSRTEHDSKGDYHNVAAAKYLAGIIKNKLKEHRERSTKSEGR